MHLKLRFRHADSFGIRESQKPNGHSIPCGQLIPKKAACVFETARYGPFLNLKLFFESLLYVRRFENNYANSAKNPLPINDIRPVKIYSADQ
ncbi:hypothetical protein GXB81_23285 [Paraburkholderia sp. Ac-20336]|uniref:hypothetical protein n=1 Tax=Burkholderiaceae TaxID=119060 RepID=UPI001422557A|nr:MULTISPECIES: hypothetical protein [Burkholderiaceae]MBN3805953.1 hypothetical protein [Paraburkholderia sp. Ac-20336]MBN3848465.1 hypothetical protein [Paraburkholderia sp. Ac-20342]NIF56556.1 hypothetical protein [Burkholderia sp. Ax-1724]